MALKHCIQTVRPSERQIRPLGTRDVFLGDRPMYELINTYNYTVVSYLIYMLHILLMY